MSANVKVGLLGPLELRRGGDQVDVKAPKQRALLALLALEVGRVVSADELVDRVWAGEAPASAGTALQVYVSQLRKVMGADVIVTRRPGYLLDIPPVLVDAVRFEGLVGDGRGLLAAGDAESACSVFEDALSLWRGDALAEFVYEDWAASPARRLEELRLVAIEDRVDAQLQLGLGAELTSELEGLVGDYPLRERLRRHYMLALYRAGRQADALAAYQQARRALVEELGVDPSPALVELERLILQQDASLIPNRPSPPATAGDRATMAVILPAPSAAPVVRTDVCGECGAVLAGSRKFCAECGSPITTTPTARERQQRKLVTVVFCDLVSSTALGERLDAEVMRGLMNRYFDAASAVISRHGGSVEKFIGDAVVAIFGIPAIHEDDALRAVRAASEIRSAIGVLGDETENRWGATIQTRTGVNTGEVVVGDARSGQAVATGDTMNLAARLQQSAQPGEILVGDATWQLVRDAVTVEPVEPLVVKGKAGPVVAHRLESVVVGAAGHARRMDLPLVGRESERRLLRESYERWVAERACGLVTVLGTAGVGKSRLVSEVLGELVGQARIVTGRCLSYGSGITYWPLGEAIRQLAEVDEKQTPDQVRERVAQLTSGALHADAIVAGVSALIGLEGSTADVDEGRWAIRLLLEHVATRPLVVVFDDLQWAEAPFLDLVDQLADTINAPVLLLCVARPELLDQRPSWGGGKLNATTILLEPLDPSHTDQLVTQLVGGRRIPNELRVRVAAAAAGNPLFAEELLAFLQERGHIRLADKRVVVASPLDELELPPTIRALIGARLDQLPEHERDVLERGAVEGEVFHAGAVSALSAAGERPDRELQRLVRKQLVRPDQAELPGEDAYRFRHLLIRDATYDGIPKHRRAEWHEEFARWLETTVGERFSEYEEILAYHYAACYRYRTELGTHDDALRDRATALLRRSADRALSLTDLENAAVVLAQLVEILPPSHEERVIGLADLALALAFTARWQEARPTVGRALDEAPAGSRESQIYAKAAEVKIRTLGGTTRIAELAEELTPLAEEASAAGWHRAAASAWVILAECSAALLQAGGACYTAGRAREHARAAGLGWLELTADLHDGLGIAIGSLHITEAMIRCDAIFPATATRPAILAARGMFLGWLATISGDLDAGMAHFADAHSSEAVAPYYPGPATIWSGVALASLGLAEQAIPDLIAATDTLRELGRESYASTSAAAAARAFAQLGQVEHAIDYLHRAEAIAAVDDIVTNVFLCGARARLHVISGNFTEGHVEATRGVCLTKGTDSAETSGVALIDLAWVSLKVGKPEEARSVANQALDILDRRGSMPMRDLAQAILEEAERPVTT